MKSQFHLALPCINIEKTKKFYLNILNAELGRTSFNWFDINFYGTQITFTDTGDFNFEYESYNLGKDMLPTFHFGVIIDFELWEQLFKKLNAKDVKITAEAIFFEKKVGEHLSFFITDPNEYTIEFKSFKNYGEVFKV